MKGCVRERTLVALYYGEGTVRQQTHVTTCSWCQRRYQRLVADLALLRQTLHTAPLPDGVQRSTSPGLRRWPQAVLAAAVVCLMLWGSARWWNPPSQRVRTVRHEAELMQFISRQVTPALFATSDTTAPAPSEGQATSLYVQAALTDSWGCAGQETFFNGECGEQ